MNLHKVKTEDFDHKIIYSHESTQGEKEIAYPVLQIFLLHLWSDTDQKVHLI